MIDNYYDKAGRHHWRTYCDSCHALVDDTAPNKDHLAWENKGSGVCPKCGGEIHDPSAPPWNPPIR